MLTEASDTTFAVGERWKFDSVRAGARGATFTVLRIESDTAQGTIIHVGIDGVRIPSARAPGGFIEAIGHMPCTRVAIVASKPVLVEKGVALPDFEEGYAMWREAFDSGRGGVFSVSLADAVEFMARTLAG